MKQEEKKLPEGLEEAAWDCVLDSVDVNNPVLLPKYKELLTYLFKAGAEWMKAKMMEEAVECELYWDGDFLAIDLNMAALGYSERDKVRVIVIKEEQR